MLSIHPSNPQRCTPNLLPARINHNGPINDTDRYWKPSTDSKGKRHAYLRGRHLHGTSLPLPENYTGVVLHITDKQLPQSRTQAQPSNEDTEEGDAEEESMPVEVKMAEQVGEFDEIIVWGHGGEVDGGQDMFVRGITEWVGFAESMHIDADGVHDQGKAEEGSK
ncbi:ribonuclease H1 small subunit [Clathrospora elynae]|uniref:Ribonuclease H1 small subunit n=1 Tax=Clathrospora elynae TaxID=706981 RepID=A0A6A5T5Q5_9PLEO|nr:ribonuclease H1 small subunit [Clathrospora elynae]